MVDIEDLKKLPAKERVRKLKELEEARKKEISEAEELIKESMREITQSEIQIPIEQLTADSLDTLFTVEEKNMFRTKHFMAQQNADIVPEAVSRPAAGELEQVAEAEARNAPKVEGTVYGNAIEQAKQQQDPVSLYAGRHEQRSELYKAAEGAGYEASHLRHDDSKAEYETRKIKSKEVKGVY